MAYMTNTLIAQPQTPSPSLLSGVEDFLKSFTSNVVQFYGQSQRDKGAAKALEEVAKAKDKDKAGGISTTHVAILGAAAVGVALVFAFRKK